MRYEKAHKQRSKWKIIFPLLILITLIISAIMLFKNNEIKPLVVCNLTEEQYNAKLEEHEEDIYTIKDYFYYGDILNFKTQTYQLGASDDIHQKTIILKNICTGEEKAFIMEKFIDRQINLAKLDSGIYKVLISQDLTRKNIVFEGEINDFETSTLNNQHNKISYIKNSKNMLHIKVEKVESPTEKVDIVVDNIYYHRDLLGGLDTGYQNANAITFPSAEKLVALLNQAGYRSTTIRTINQEYDMYGENGRLKKIVDYKAKYFISLGVDYSNLSSTAGVYLENSYLASKNLPNSIMYTVFNNSDYTSSSIHNVNEYGVLRNEPLLGIDNVHYYDSNLYIREIGGYATGAGHFSESSQKNASFASNNRNGVYGLYLSLGFQTNNNDMELLKSNRLLELFVDGFKMR